MQQITLAVHTWGMARKCGKAPRDMRPAKSYVLLQRRSPVNTMGTPSTVTQVAPPDA